MRHEIETAQQRQATTIEEWKSETLSSRRTGLSPLRRIAAVVAGTSAFTLAGSYAASQPAATPPSSSTETQADPGSALYHRQDKYPEPIASAFFNFRQDLGLGALSTVREIQIHREKPTTGRTWVYYHRPSFALIETAKPIEDLPSYVVGKATLGEDTILTFRVQLTSEELRRVCTHEVITQDKHYALQKNSADATPLVNRWPITHAKFKLRNSSTGQVLGFGSTGSLASSGDEAEFKVRFTPETLRAFKEAARANQIDFIPRFTDAGKYLGEATIDQSGVLEITQAISQQFTSEQREGRAPVFQAQRNDFAKKMSAQLGKKARVNHPDALEFARSLAQANVIANFFTQEQSVPLHELVRKHPEIDAQLAEYLRPYVQRISNSTANSDVTTTTEENSTKTTLSASGGFSGFGFKIGGGAERVKQELDRLQKETGVTFVYSVEDEMAHPSSVSVGYFISGVQSIDVRDTVEAYIELSPDQFYLEDSAIPCTFTATFVRRHLQGPVDELTQLDAANKEIGILKQTLLSAQSTNKGLQEEQEKMAAQLKAKNDEVERLTREVSKLTRANSGLENKVSDLGRQVELLTVRLRDVKNGY